MKEQKKTQDWFDKYQRILEIIKSDKKDYYDLVNLNSLTVRLTQELFKECNAKEFDVTACGRTDYNIWEGDSYLNAYKKIQEGIYSYVEGYIITPEGTLIAHAWNSLNETNKHYDFTICKNDSLRYFGIVVPKLIVEETSFQHECISGPILPSISPEQMKGMEF